MPSSPEIDLAIIKEKAGHYITKFGARLGKDEIEPVAFGLKALKLTIIFDENKGSTDNLEEQLTTIKGVQSCEAISVSRALG